MTGDLAAPSSIDEPAIPAEVVAALALPSIDLARLRLPPLGWLFVAGAALVAALRLGSIVGTPADQLPAHLLFDVTGVAVCLLPAALLRRAPDALRTHRLLLAGLAAAMLAELARAVLAAFLPAGANGGTWLWSLLDAGWPVLGPLGSVLAGLGLMRLRGPARVRVALLAGIAAAYVALALLPNVVLDLALSESTGPTAGVSAVFFHGVVPVAAAFAAWVPVCAWLDRERPTAFWGLLALALPLTLAMRAFELPGVVEAAVFRSNVLFVAITSVDALAAAAIAALALVAYGRLLPLDARPD